MSRSVSARSRIPRENRNSVDRTYAGSSDEEDWRPSKPARRRVRFNPRTQAFSPPRLSSDESEDGPSASTSCPETATKKSLRELQQEQEFQEWWDVETRKVMEEELRKEIQARCDEKSSRGRGKGKPGCRGGDTIGKNDPNSGIGVVGKARGENSSKDESENEPSRHQESWEPNPWPSLDNWWKPYSNRRDVLLSPFNPDYYRREVEEELRTGNGTGRQVNRHRHHAKTGATDGEASVLQRRDSEHQRYKQHGRKQQLQNDRNRSDIVGMGSPISSTTKWTSPFLRSRV